MLQSRVCCLEHRRARRACPLMSRRPDWRDRSHRRLWRKASVCRLLSCAHLLIGQLNPVRVLLGKGSLLVAVRLRRRSPYRLARGIPCRRCPESPDGIKPPSCLGSLGLLPACVPAWDRSQFAPVVSLSALRSVSPRGARLLGVERVRRSRWRVSWARNVGPSGHPGLTGLSVIFCLAAQPRPRNMVGL